MISLRRCQLNQGWTSLDKGKVGEEEVCRRFQGREDGSGRESLCKDGANVYLHMFYHQFFHTWQK